MATTRLQALTAGRSIVCQEKDRDRFGRVVAICRASGEDLGVIMVREGFAWAFTRFSVDYVGEQEEARTANRGVHAHDYVPAWEWRAQHRAKTVQ
jgi:endonuclease YncB( thermonuclease family)